MTELKEQMYMSAYDYLRGIVEKLQLQITDLEERNQHLTTALYDSRMDRGGTLYQGDGVSNVNSQDFPV